MSSDDRATGCGDVEAQNLVRQSGEAKREREERIRHLEKEAFQLANYYFVFQGVIFTSFYHVPHLTCNYHWFPFSLSLLAGLLNFFALLRIAMRYKSALDDADISSAGGGGVIAVACAGYWRCFYVVGCMLVVLAFLAVTLAGCWLITCTRHAA